MKNFTLLVALFFSLTLVAQDHPGKRPELLMGKEVTIDKLGPIYIDKGYERFYTDENLRKTYDQNSSSKTNHQALEGKMFKVVDVKEYPYNKSVHVIKLESPEGVVLYHRYEQKGQYYFIVKGGLDYPDDFYCDLIAEKPSPDTGTTDYVIEAYSGLSLIKTKGKLSGYLLYVSIVQGGDLDKSGGVIITLDNGAKIERPDHIPQVGLNSYGDYMYSAYIELTAKEIELLKAHTITNSQIGAVKRKEYSEDKLKNALPCLMTK